MARFARRARMLKPDEFKAAFEKGRRYNDTLLTAVVSPNTLEYPRLGLALAKKSIPLAVSRNRIKRQARDSFRLNQQNLPAVDIVILGRPAAVKGSPAQLRAALQNFWKRIAESCAALQSS